jgi:hypothetical protein
MCKIGRSWDSRAQSLVTFRSIYQIRPINRTGRRGNKFRSHRHPWIHDYVLLATRLVDNAVAQNAVIHCWMAPLKTPACVEFCSATEAVIPLTSGISSMISVTPKTCCTRTTSGTPKAQGKNQDKFRLPYHVNAVELQRN